MIFQNVKAYFALSALSALSLFAGCAKHHSSIEDNLIPFRLAGIGLSMSNSEIKDTGLIQVNCRADGIGKKVILKCDIQNDPTIDDSKKLKFFGVNLSGGAVEYFGVAGESVAMLRFYTEEGVASIPQKLIEQSWGVERRCISGAEMLKAVRAKPKNTSDLALLSKFYEQSLAPHDENDFACISKKGESLLVNDHYSESKRFYSIILFRPKKEWLDFFERTMGLV